MCEVTSSPKTLKTDLSSFSDAFGANLRSCAIRSAAESWRSNTVGPSNRREHLVRFTKWRENSKISVHKKRGKRASLQLRRMYLIFGYLFAVVLGAADECPHYPQPVPLSPSDPVLQQGFLALNEFLQKKVSATVWSDWRWEVTRFWCPETFVCLSFGSFEEKVCPPLGSLTLWPFHEAC